MSSVRASERERERTLRVLHDGCADGRISVTTLEQRVERALAARSIDELRRLTIDVKPVSRLRAWLAQVMTLHAHSAAAGAACLWLEDVGARPFVVGRSRKADFVISDECVSRRHAHIVRTADGFVLVDLGSTNGTWLGGRRVGEVAVAAGDVIELGKVELRLR